MSSLLVYRQAGQVGRAAQGKKELCTSEFDLLPDEQFVESPILLDMRRARSFLISYSLLHSGHYGAQLTPPTTDNSPLLHLNPSLAIGGISTVESIRKRKCISLPLPALEQIR